MMTADGPMVLEFNVRLGDPEAQALLLRLEDDLLTLMLEGASIGFTASRLYFRKEASAVVVLVSEGYPERPIKGEPITGVERAEQVPGAAVFHAGTAMVDGRLVAAGGRVMNVGGTGPDLASALRTAYAAAAQIDWPSKRMRHDIGRSFVQRALLTPETGSFNLKDLGLEGPGKR
jgi:phosphoribosylamine--glycine ligase